MRWLILAIWMGLAASPVAGATEGRIIKVLPQFLDLKGHESVSPSLYDRDAYQSYLRRNPDKRAGLQFKIRWKAKPASSRDLRLRLEVRGVSRGEAPKAGTLEKTVQQVHWYSHWASITMDEKTYREFGEVTAWRVTLWDGETLLGEQKSFLW